jgi:hypothetical protein
MKYPWLVVGAKVTPVNPNPAWAEVLGQSIVPPQFGTVYTIAAVGEFLGELVFSITELPSDQGFLPGDFQPVTDQKRDTSIEAFREIDRKVFDKPKVDA